MSESASTTTPVPPLRHIPTLDGLRGVAALGVVWAHFPRIGETQIAGLFQDLSEKTRSGALAVDVFFVLSGFLITRIILREIAEHRFSLRVFVAKRALRIFPIYYLTLFLLACCYPISQQWVAAACYVENYTMPFEIAPHPLRHTWSLAVEEQFYLVWPLLFALLPVVTVKRLAWPLGPLLAVATIAATFVFVNAELAWKLVYGGLPFRMLSLLFGATFAFHEARIRRWKPSVVFIAGAFCYLSMLFCGYGFLKTSWTVFRFASVPLSAITSLMIVQFAVCADDRRGPVQRLLTSTMLTGAGRISYGIYLYHHVLLYCLLTPEGLDSRDVTVTFVQAMAAAALCLLIPWVSWHVVERPLLGLKSRFAVEPFPQTELAVVGVEPANQSRLPTETVTHPSRAA